MRFLAILLAVLFTTGLAKPTLDVLVISDFSLAFVPSPLDRSFLSSGPFVCPSSAYPNALSQFQFTSDVIDGVKRDIPMRIQYYVYSGGDGDPIGNVYSSRDNFTETSIPAYTKFCAEGPEENDFERFIKLTITPTIKTELLILFTAAPQAQIDKALPILSNNVSKVIVLGLNGANAHNSYPESAVSLPDFSEPERVSCMVNELYETIHGKVGDVDAVAICYPVREETTTIAETTSTIPTETTTPETTTAIPPMRILFVNDFTSDFMPDSSDRAQRPSKAIKCPGGMATSGADEFDFTNNIVQGISDEHPTEIYYYADIGDSHPINANQMTKDTFAQEAGVEFKDWVCYDDPQPSDLQRLMETIDEFQFNINMDVIVILSAASQYQFNAAFPHDFGQASVLTVGMKGASAFNAYPTASTFIDDFSHPEVITCMIEAAYRGETNPVELCGANTKQQMKILFINDFTTDFLGDDRGFSRAKRPSNAIKCPGGANPSAADEFDFTNKIVQEISEDVPTTIYYYAYNGDQHAIPPPIDPSHFEKDTEFKDVVCFEDDPLPSDLTSLVTQIERLDDELDIIVLLSAAPQSQFDAAFPLKFGHATVIAVVLSGASAFNAYPNTSINIIDFSQPEVITCMIEAVYRGEENPVKICRPPMTILFINDFTTDFIGDGLMLKNIPSSRASYGKCPGGAYPEAGLEFNYTVDIVNSIRTDAQIMFSEYDGGYYCAIDGILYDKTDFGNLANSAFKNACLDDHTATDFTALTMYLRYVPADILVLFTAVPLSQPLNLPNFKRVIVVGLNGASVSSAYPNSAVSITDFSRPQVISCMIDRLWDNISDASLLSCTN